MPDLIKPFHPSVHAAVPPGLQEEVKDALLIVAFQFSTWYVVCQRPLSYAVVVVEEYAVTKGAEEVVVDAEVVAAARKKGVKVLEVVKVDMVGVGAAGGGNETSAIGPGATTATGTWEDGDAIVVVMVEEDGAGVKAGGGAMEADVVVAWVQSDVAELARGGAASVAGFFVVVGGIGTVVEDVDEDGEEEEGEGAVVVVELEALGVGMISTVTVLGGSASTTVYGGGGLCSGAASMAMVVGWPEITTTVVVTVCVAGEAVTVAVAVSVSSTVSSTVACEACCDDAAAPEPPSTGTTEYVLRFSRCLSWFWLASGRGEAVERSAMARRVRTIMAAAVTR